MHIRADAPSAFPHTCRDSRIVPLFGRPSIPSRHLGSHDMSLMEVICRTFATSAGANKHVDACLCCLLCLTQSLSMWCRFDGTKVSQCSDASFVADVRTVQAVSYKV